MFLKHAFGLPGRALVLFHQRFDSHLRAVVATTAAAASGHFSLWGCICSVGGTVEIKSKSEMGASNIG